MQFDLTKLAFALAAYHADRGAYPAKLADLVPKYVAEVPKDIFSAAELHYRWEGGGYLLYSVGVNGAEAVVCWLFRLSAAARIIVGWVKHGSPCVMVRLRELPLEQQEALSRVRLCAQPTISLAVRSTHPPLGSQRC